MCIKETEIVRREMYPVAYSLKWGFWDGEESIANEYTVDGRDKYRVLEGTNGGIELWVDCSLELG